MAKQNKNNSQSGRYITLYHDLLNSPAYRALSTSAKTLLVDMRLSYNGSNNGNISAVFAELKHRGWRSPATLSKSLYELRSLGFIALTKEGGLKQGTRVCSPYRFTDLPVLDIPKHCIQAMKATYDYRSYKTLSEAGLALAQGCSKLKADGVKKQSEKKSPVQKKVVIAAKNVLDVEFSGSKNEQRSLSSLQNMYSGLTR